jgi:GNAT superfamily N-acetyltransferase
MVDSRSLPSHCLLRPATATDQAALKQLLARLEQEIAPRNRQRRLLVGLVGLGVLLLYGALYLGMVPGGQWLIPPGVSQRVAQAVISGLGVVLTGVALAQWVNRQPDWRLYWVVACHEQVVACAKLQPFKQYSILYDVYVGTEWRHQGLGSHLVSQLAQVATQPLYLACFPPRLGFYTRLGFTPVAPGRLPTLLRYDLGLPNRAGIIALVWPG